VEYKVPEESKFRIKTRPIHKLVLVVPVEEQTIEDPEGPKDEQRSRQEGPGSDNVEEDVREREPEQETSHKRPLARQYLTKMCPAEKAKTGC
jgi:hypothetical protein